MSRKYDMFSDSDMKRFIKDLENDTANIIQKQLDNFSCDNCGKKFKAKLGLNRCPHCNQEINISFETK